jgi:DNA-binding MarR family transcriptional regulator
MTLSEARPEFGFHISSIFLDPIYMYIHLFCMRISSLPVLPCACASLRRAARATSHFYEEALRQAGLRISQFTVMQVLSLVGDINQGRLGKILAMDSTSLTRTLAILVREGWVTKGRGEDRREWRIRLTKSGAARFQMARPYWEDAQTRMRQRLGEHRWGELTELTNYVTGVVTEDGDV